VAIGAPAAGDVDEDNLPAKARVAVGDDPSLKIREAEVQWLIGVFKSGVLRGIIGRRQALGASRFGPKSDQRLGFMIVAACNLQGTIRKWCGLKVERPFSSEMTEDEFPAPIAAGKGSGIAIDG